MELMTSAGEGDFAFPLTVSTRFLHMFAEVMVGWTLGQQALLAQQKLAAGATGDDELFYEAKIHTARFFAANVLPGVRMKAAVIKGHDTTALDFPEEAF